MKLLIVEDEFKIGSYLKKGFIELGYVVDFVYDGVDGFYQVIINYYDFIILDIMFLKLNGW